MGRYLLSVIAAAVLVSVLTSLTQGKLALSGILRLLCGSFLLVVLLQPVIHFDFGYIDTFLADMTPEAELVSSRGEEMARSQISEIIKADTQAYILDKAGLYNAQLQVEVTLSDGELPVPVSVTIYGETTEQIRESLGSIMERELDIPKECQIWIGNP